MRWSDLVPPILMSQKATNVTRAIVSFFGLEPRFSDRDFENFAKQGFNANVWVYRCVMAIAQNAAGVPWLLYNGPGKQKEFVEHELLNLLQRPNEYQSRQEYFEELIAFALIAGNSYMHMNGPTVGPPRELWTLRPDRVSVLPDKQNFIGGYVYQVGDNKVKLSANQVGHIKFFNPVNDFYGLSPIEVAGRGIDNDNAANAWNNALLNNSARPSGAMVTDETLTDPQYNKLKKELEEQYRGAKKAGKPLLLEGGLKWQEMGLSPTDMDFIENKKMSRLEICAAFGVPPEMIGDKERATYSNYQEARKAFYEDAVLPMLDRVRDKLNAKLVPLFGDNLYLDYNKDAIEALQENRDAVVKRANESYKTGILRKNEARKELGYEEVEGGDEFYKAPEPVNKESQKNDFFLTKKALNLATDEAKTMYWRAMDRRRQSYYKRMVDKVGKRFKSERKAVLKAFISGGQTEAINAIDMQKEDWQKLYVDIYIEVMQDFGNSLFNQLKSDAKDLEIKGPDIPHEEAFDVFDNAVQDFIASTVAKKVVAVTDTTKQKIRDLIAAGEAEGEGIPELSERIDTLYLEQIIPHRSTVIARTEVIGASNAGNRYAAKQTGLNLQKEWIATRDKRTRDENDLFNHEDMDGVKVDMDEPYRVPGKKGDDFVMFPGDPEGAKANIIQCRCTEGYIVIN